MKIGQRYKMILKGVGASKGIKIGKVRVIVNYNDISLVNKGDIVVTHNNSPLYSLAFINASALISEKGGSLSHLAIVARELEKPCVLNVENATKILKNGMLVKVDGLNGRIYTNEDI